MNKSTNGGNIIVFQFWLTLTHEFKCHFQSLSCFTSLLCIPAEFLFDSDPSESLSQ